MKFTNKNKKFFVIIAKVFLCFNFINGTAQKDLQQSTEEAKKRFLKSTLNDNTLSDVIQDSEIPIECFKREKSRDLSKEVDYNHRYWEIKTFLEKYETFASLEGEKGKEKAEIDETLKKPIDSKKAYDDLETSSNHEPSTTNKGALSEVKLKQENLTATDIARQECKIRDFVTKEKFKERNESFQNRIKIFENFREGLNLKKRQETQPKLRIDSRVAEKINFFEKSDKSNGRFISENESHTSLSSNQELPRKKIHDNKTDGTPYEKTSLAEKRENILVKHRDFTTSEIDNMLNECLTHKNFFIKRFKSHNILLGYIRYSAETAKQVALNPKNFHFKNRRNLEPRAIAIRKIHSLKDDSVKLADTNKEHQNEMVSYIKIANNVYEQLKNIEELVGKNVHSYNHNTSKPLSEDEELFMVELKKIIYSIQTTREKRGKPQEIVYAGWIDDEKFLSYTDNKDKRAFS